MKHEIIITIECNKLNCKMPSLLLLWDVNLWGHGAILAFFCKEIFFMIFPSFLSFSMMHLSSENWSKWMAHPFAWWFRGKSIIIEWRIYLAMSSHKSCYNKFYFRRDEIKVNLPNRLKLFWNENFAKFACNLVICLPQATWGDFAFLMCCMRLISKCDFFV